MTNYQAELFADHIQEMKNALANDKEFSMVAYCLEMAQLELSLVLAKRDATFAEANPHMFFEELSKKIPRNSCLDPPFSSCIAPKKGE